MLLKSEGGGGVHVKRTVTNKGGGGGGAKTESFEQTYFLNDPYRRWISIV